jgi:hypothetical protein
LSLLARLRGNSSASAEAQPGEPPPLSALERLLARCIAGEEPIPQLVAELLRSQVFVLFHGEPTPAGPPSPLRPLVVESSQGHLAVAVFTHPDRVTRLAKLHPEFRTGLQVAFTWVVQSAPEGLGLVLNPGSSLCIEQAPCGVVELRRAVASGAPSS